MAHSILPRRMMPRRTTPLACRGFPLAGKKTGRRHWGTSSHSHWGKRHGVVLRVVRLSERERHVMSGCKLGAHIPRRRQEILLRIKREAFARSDTPRHSSPLTILGMPHASIPENDGVTDSLDTRYNRSMECSIWEAAKHCSCCRGMSCDGIVPESCRKEKRPVLLRTSLSSQFLDLLAFRIPERVSIPQ